MTISNLALQSPSWQRLSSVSEVLFVVGKKIVHLTSAHRASDVRVFEKECRSLAKAGYNVTLIARDPPAVAVDGVKFVGVQSLHKSRLKRFVFTTADVLRNAWRANADLYHFHDPELMPAGALLKLTGAKVVYDVHEDVPNQLLSKAWLPRWTRKPLSLAIGAVEYICTRVFFSAVIAAPPFIARNFSSARTTTVQNFPLSEEFQGVLAGTDFAQRPMTISYVGGITRIRGILENVEAMSHVRTSGARLVLIGSFDEAAVRREAVALVGWAHVDYRGLSDGLQSPADGALRGSFRAPNDSVAVPPET